MTCSCEFSTWLRDTVSGYGVTGLMMVVFILLVWWGNRSMRREHLGKVPMSKFLILNSSSVCMFFFAAAILTALLVRFIIS